MRVTVTGATGFIGAHVVNALSRRGHDVVLFVRDKTKVDAAMAPFRIRPRSIFIGDIADADAVAASLDGVEAVVHCAAKVSLHSAQAAHMIETNSDGANNVLGQAVRLGLDPIVHVSSITAVYPPAGTVMGPEDPVTEGLSAYGHSKALCETYARSLQEDHPVVIVYPGGVIGPHCAGSYEMLDAIVMLYAKGIVPIPRGGHTSLVDVRDLAETIARAIEPGLGPRRFMVGGRWASFEHWIEQLEQAGGRSFRYPRLPGALLRGIGRTLETAAHLTKTEPMMTREQAVIMSQAAPTDDTAVAEQLGIRYRPLSETIDDLVRWLVDDGRVPRSQAPRLAGS